MISSALTLAMLIAAAGQTGDDEARWRHTEVVQDTVVHLAFDPLTYFADEPSGFDTVRIVYTGDDYGWPVYAIALRDACGRDRSAGCHQQFRARMVRAPETDPQARPRSRGHTLVMGLSDAGTESPQKLAELLGDGRVEWLEADLATCPQAIQTLAKAADLTWVVKARVAPSAKQELNLVLHADNVKVEFFDFARKSTYEGYIADGSPAEWATQLAGDLETCWKPAKAPAPWTRPLDSAN